MKVLQILYSGLGGHGSVVFSMIDADRQNVWEHVLIFYGIEELKPEYKQRCEQKNIRFYFIKKRKGFDLKGYLEVEKLIKRENPDHIFLHTVTLALFCTLLKSSLRSRIVLVEHTPNALKPRFEQFSSFVGMQIFRKIVLLTEDYRGELESLFGCFFHPGKIHIIPNGIDTRFYSPSNPSSAGDRDFVISMVGRFSETKDQLTLLRAFAQVIRSGRYPNLLLKLAGDGAKRPAIEQAVQEENLKAHCTLTGMLNERDVRDLLRQTHIYVHSSLSETMSTSIMQAMACGLPVVASSIDGIRNMIIHNETGVLVTSQAPNAFAVAIFDLLENSSKRIYLGDRARQHAESNFSSITMFALYQNLLVNK